MNLMPSTSPRSVPAATGKTEGFSQLRLPLCREVGRDGLFLKNSTFADNVRRSVVKRLPQGAPERMADLLGCRVDTIYSQHEGEARYSLDAFVTGLTQVPRHEARHVLRKIAREFGALVIEDPCLDDSAVSA